MAWTEHLSAPAPELVWGLVSRGIGLTFLISFISLALQVVPIAGKDGIVPVRDTLLAIERHFPTWRRFAYFPTLLWLNRSDTALRALPWAGIAASVAVIVGGPWTPWAMAVCFIAYLSLDRPMFLVYPWDSVLFEAGFWGMFLPATHFLPQIAAASAPLPAVAWVFRLLVFRVMLGFGKHKFIGTTAKDAGFLKSFLVQQPLPTPLGLLSHKLPMWSLKLGLMAMFVIEIPLCFAVFFPGPVSSFAALAMMGLMIAIWLTGNYGYFNLIVIVIALCWLDNRTALAFSFADFFSLEGPWLVHGLVLLHTLLALIAFPFNTFCSHTWMMWSPWSRLRPKILRWPVTLTRLFHPLRWVHAYGVFPPRSPPPIKLAPVVEASWDGHEWLPFTYRHAPTAETSVPTFCAPHHERFDQAVVYDTLGFNESSVWRNVIGRWDPYGHGGVPAALMFLHRIVEGTVPSTRFYDRSLEKARGRPLLARVRLYMLEPTTWAEMRAGRWWRRSLVGPHFPPIGREDGFWEHPLPPPELWHFDDLIWLRRSHLGKLMNRAARGEDPHSLVLIEAEAVAREDVERFWTEFLPAANRDRREDWQGLRAVVARLRDQYGRLSLYRFELIAARYAVLLFARLEPLFLDGGLRPVFGSGAATLDVKTNYHLRLLALHVVAEGKEAYDAVMKDPMLAREHHERMSLYSGNRLRALFRYEDFVYQSQKLRLLDAWHQQAGRPEPSEQQRRTAERFEGIARRLWGAMDMVDFLKTQFTTEEDVLDVPERWPRFAVNDDDEVVRVAQAQESAN